MSVTWVISMVAQGRVLISVRDMGYQYGSTGTCAGKRLLDGLSVC